MMLPVLIGQTRCGSIIPRPLVRRKSVVRHASSSPRVSSSPMARRRPPRFLFTLMALLVIGLLYLGQQAGLIAPDAGPEPAGELRANVTIAQLFEAERSDVVLTFDATVVRLLPDDLEGSKHQKFLVEADGGITVLVAHNIDEDLAAGRVPVEVGDPVRIRGEYEWTDKGGTVHWTHYDPRGNHEDGWIEHEGIRYGDRPE
jgi:hypothetical protein